MNHIEPGSMVRNENDEWPKDSPIGTFDIALKPLGVGDHPGVTAHIQFVCPHGKRCGVFLAPTFIPRPADDKCNAWAWDGNVDQPTITPSINCIAEKDGKPTGGCGWHGFITNGRFA